VSKTRDGKVDRLDALRVAIVLKGILAHGCEHIEIAGSLRRHRQQVGDIEIVAIGLSLETTDLWGKPVVREENMAARLLTDLCNGGNREWAWDDITPRHGPLYFRLRHVPTPIAADVFFCKAHTFPIHLLIRTGPADYSHTVAKRARQMGMSFQHGFELHRHTTSCHGAGSPDCGGMLVVADERTLCKLLAIPYLEPDERDDRAKWGMS
jgi:DNA polymerase/3'-5' exonuclease PolX